MVSVESKTNTRSTQLLGPVLLPKFPIKNIMLFSSSLPLFYHFTHLPKLAFHSISFLTTLLKTEAIESVTSVQHSPSHSPQEHLTPPHKNKSWQAEVSLGTTTHGSKSDTGSRRCYLTPQETAAPQQTAAPQPPAEKFLPWSSYKSRASRCQEPLLYHCQTLPRALEGSYPSATISQKCF